jgi:hypothetical protein
MDSTNDRTTRKQYSMQYKLVRKGINEIVDTVNTKSDREAKQYFQLKKQLDKESFDNLYEVKEDDRN